MSKEQAAFVAALPLVHAEAMRLGFYVTGQALHKAVRMLHVDIVSIYERSER